MRAKRPLAPDVIPDHLGGFMCAKGHCAIYPDKISATSKGTTIRWRHVERHPVCETVDLRFLP